MPLSSSLHAFDPAHAPAAVRPTAAATWAVALITPVAPMLWAAAMTPPDAMDATPPPPAVAADDMPEAAKEPPAIPAEVKPAPAATAGITTGAAKNSGRIPKDVLYGELATGHCPTGHQALHFKDVCKSDLKLADIDPGSWEQIADDRSAWRSAVQKEVRTGEDKRNRLLEDKR